ncbi:RNA methyltransferase, partial [Ralstonia solanacearum]
MNPASRASETSPARDNDALRQRAARCRFVLVETSHPGNVGSTARALKTMGFGESGSYVLVRPREPGAQSHPDAVAMASGADDVLADARVVDDVGEALAGASLVIALTARPREFG